MKMDKSERRNCRMETSLSVSDFLDPELEPNSRLACFNQLRKIRNIIKKPLHTPSQRMFDTDNITSNKKSLPFEFDKLQNTEQNTNNSIEVISISSASSLGSSNQNQALTPKKSIIANNLKYRQCRKSLFKSIVTKDIKNKQNSTDKTLTATNFSPQTFSTPLHGKKNNENLNKISHLDNNLQAETFEKDKNKEIYTDDKNKSLTSRAENKEKFDETLNSNIDCTIQKSNKALSIKTIINPIEMEVSDTFHTNVPNEQYNPLKKKEQTIHKTEKILIEDDDDDDNTLSRSEKEIVEIPIENCQLDEPELENISNGDLLQNVLENISLKSNCKPSKIPKSTTPFTKNVQSSPFKKKANLEKVVDQIVTKTSYKNDLPGLKKSTKKPKTSSGKSITPPIPVITSPSIVINQIFNNGIPNNIITSSAEHPNFQIVDVQTIPPPPEFQSVEKDKMGKKGSSDIVTEDEDDLMLGKSHKASICENITKKTKTTSKSFSNKNNAFYALNSIDGNKVLDQITFTSTTNKKISTSIPIDHSLLTEDGSKSNALDEQLDDSFKSNNIHQAKKASNELEENHPINQSKETSPINETNAEPLEKNKTLSNSSKNQKRDSIIPLDLRKRKRLSKKRNLRSRATKANAEETKAAHLQLQDYFSNTDDNVFEKLLRSKDKSYSRKNERNSTTIKFSNNKISSQNIRWPPNNRNDLGDNDPFVFREMNELETAGKQKRYSSLYNERMEIQSKTINDNVVQNKESDNIKNLQKELNVLISDKFIYNEGEMLNNESNFRWPSPPPALTNNFDSEPDKQPSPKNNEIPASPLFHSTRNLRKRRLTINISENNALNAQPNSKKKRISRSRNKNLCETPNTAANSTALILATNEILVHDDPSAASKIWSDAALLNSFNLDKSMKLRYSQELKKSRDSNKQYIEEYLQLPDKIQRKSKKEKRKLYKKGVSDSETSVIEKHPDQILDNSTSTKNESRQVNSNEVISEKETVPSSSKSSQPDKIKSNDFEFKKPLKPAPRSRNRIKRELKNLLKIHPMYKLQIDESVQAIVDDNGNEVRRSGRTKANDKPIYDLELYYCKLISQDNKRISKLYEAEKRQTKSKTDKNVEKKKVGRKKKNLTSNEIDTNNVFVQNNNESVNINKNTSSTAKQKKKKNENENEFVSEKDEIPSSLNSEPFKDNTNLISKRAHNTRNILLRSKNHLNNKHEQVNRVQNTLESKEMETEQYSQPIESNSDENKCYKKKLVVKLKRRDYSLLQENQTNYDQIQLDSENVESNANARVTASKISKSRKNKVLTNEVKMRSDNQSVSNQPGKSCLNKSMVSDVESNSDVQSTDSNPSERLKFFNWIMSFNCNQDKSKQNDLDVSSNSEGYRLASLNNMIFEKRRGVYYALYRTAVTSGYMKLLPGIHKPKAKSGRFFLKFLVLAGHVNASINNIDLEFEPGDHIEVEKDQMYSIQNKSNEVCCLYFTRNNHN